MKPYVPAADEDLSVILRANLDTGDFSINGQKSSATLKKDAGHLRVLVWNLGNAAKTGSVEVAGGTLEGLPAEIALGPRGTPPAAFDCTFTPAGTNLNLVLTGIFNGKRSSRLFIPVQVKK